MRVGIIGLGARLGRLSALFGKADQDLKVTAFVDPAPAGMKYLREGGMELPVSCDTVDDMLGAHRLDLVMIGSPNAMHFGHLEAVLRSDIRHIFCEKPVVSTLDETMRLARLIARSDGHRRIIVGLVLRYSSHYRLLRAALDDGLLGTLMSMEACEHIGPYHGSFFMRDWRRLVALSGGFMLEKCCHDLDLYQSIARARPARVASFGGRRKFLPEGRPEGRPDYLDAMQPRWGGIADAFGGAGDIIDFQTALVQYESGASLAFHTNLNVPDEYRRFAIIGTKAMAEGDFIRGGFSVTASDTGERLVDHMTVGTGEQKGHYGADEAMVRDLVDYLGGGNGAALPVGVIDALEAGLTAMAMDRARQDGAVVEMAPLWNRFDDALAGGDAQPG